MNEFKNGRGNQAKCDTARADEIAECHQKAAGATANEPNASPYEDPAYKSLSQQWLGKQASWLGAISSCVAQKAADATKDTAYCGTKANAVYARRAPSRPAGTSARTSRTPRASRRTTRAAA